jgi:hypothetical protein
MDISEFIDSYSDDLISLREGSLALLTHPLHPNEATAYLMDASFCRMLAIIVIGSIEAMLSAWVERDRVDVLRKYFAEGVRNGERIQSLYEAFHNAGIAVDRDVFDDYLAVKYIRNTIIHGKWKPDEKEWVAGRGFPTDSRQLIAEHWTRIEHVNESMMLYIALTSYATPDKSTKPPAIIKLEKHDREQDPHVGVLSGRDIDKILWNNLERISAIFGTAIQDAAASAEYNLTDGRSAEQIQTLAPSDAKRRFYTAARRAGLANFETLAQHRSLVTTALDSWRDYYQRVTTRFEIDETSIAASLAVFDDTRFDPSAPHWSVLQNLNESDGRRLLRRVWPAADSTWSIRRYRRFVSVGMLTICLAI